MIRVISIIAVIVILGCGPKKSSDITVIERTSESGSISVEIPSQPTFDRDELPPSVKPGDVAAVITLEPIEDEQPSHGQTASMLAPGPGEPIPNAQSSSVSYQAPAKKRGKIYVLKDGRTVADKGTAEHIKSVETVKRSYKWLWWVSGAALLAAVIAWIVARITPIMELVTRWFRK